MKRSGIPLKPVFFFIIAWIMFHKNIFESGNLGMVMFTPVAQSHPIIPARAPGLRAGAHDLQGARAVGPGSSHGVDQGLGQSWRHISAMRLSQDVLSQVFRWIAWWRTIIDHPFFTSWTFSISTTSLPTDSSCSMITSHDMHISSDFIRFHHSSSGITIAYAPAQISASGMIRWSQVHLSKTGQPHDEASAVLLALRENFASGILSKMALFVGTWCLKCLKCLNHNNLGSLGYTMFKQIHFWILMACSNQMVQPT